MAARSVGVTGQAPGVAGSPTGVTGRKGTILHAGDKPGPAGYGPTLPPILHQLWPKPIKPPPRRPDREVVGQQTLDRPRRTRVTVSVTAHASPRWTGAASPGNADANNLALSRDREKAVRDELERQLRAALPDEQLVFDYQKAGVPNALDAVAPIDVDSKAVGSTETLKEAGKAGRSANDPAMRRVDIRFTLASAIDTDNVTTVNERQAVRGDSREWSIKIGMEIQVEFEVGGGGFNFVLKNRRTGQEVDGWAGYVSGGPGASLPIPTIDFGWNDFTTSEPAVFSDFQHCAIAVASSGFNALLFGYEASSLTITGLPGGNVIVDTGGFVMGGAGITIAAAKVGVMRLDSTPDTYMARIDHDEHKYATSRLTDVQQHAVLFATEKSIISGEEQQALKRFVQSAAQAYQRPGVYRSP